MGSHSARALVVLAVIGRSAIVQLAAVIAGILLVALGGVVVARRMRQRRVAA